MEEQITLAASRKDREVQNAESSSAAANRNLSQLQTTLNINRRTLAEKNAELTQLEKKVRDGLEESGQLTVEAAIAEAEEQVQTVRK
jgi:DNA repair protein RAD50